MSTENALVLYNSDRTILWKLYNSPNPISLYGLHKEFGLSPAQLGTFVAKLKKINVISADEENIQLTEYGKKWVLAHRNKIFISNLVWDWQEIPKEMKRKQIELNSPYLPKKRDLGAYFFDDLLNIRRKG